MHIHLPPYARWSRAILERFARTAPPNTRLDVTTMSLIGKPRVSSMVLSDLRPANARLGTVNFVRDTRLVDAGRKWWRFRAVRGFNVQEGVEGVAKSGWVWKGLKEGIAKRAAEKK
jgi:predicted YcjX-like family ATPase